MSAPRSTRVLIIGFGAKPGLLDRTRAQVIVTEQKPGSAKRWRITKNKTGKTLTLKP